MPPSSEASLTAGMKTSQVWVPQGSAAELDAVSALNVPPIQQQVVRLGSIETPLVALLRRWLSPTVVVLMLLLCMLFGAQPPTPPCGALELAALLFSRLIFRPMELRWEAGTAVLAQVKLSRLVFEWTAVVVLLLTLGFTLGVTPLFPAHVMLAWFALTPLALMLSQYLGTRVIEQSRPAARRHIIIGVNDVGLELARRAARNTCLGEFMGFFDFRSPDRLPETSRDYFAGRCQDVAEFVRLHAIEAIYLALPISNAPRIKELLRQLRDTTASIYFVPDIFAFDLVQARCMEVNGMPAFSVCDTPFTGMNALRKRAADIILACTALMLGWPFMLIVAALVKLTSPGPVLFKQRRYGLNGEEILVYKFRSMLVCEDGLEITQATKCDERVTRVGNFLRRTSLDELPQLLNVLEGKMSFVGPRPHAVAHNEQYRKLISGYMIRHKVRPGITGWAQVNGLRGETQTVEKMRLRVQYDLDYLRNWSLWLDLKIIVRTALIVLRDANAY